jgi:hypothetical protein
MYPSCTGVFLGSLAAVLAQVYPDCLHGLFQFGPKSKQAEVLSCKGGAEWATLYFSIAVSVAGFFGAYKLIMVQQ